MPREAATPAEIHLTLFPKPGECCSFPDEALEARWARLLEVREAVLKALEQARNAKKINSGLEARVELAADAQLAPLLRDYAAWLPTLFIVSQVELADGGPSAATASEILPGLGVTIHRADGKKCERCENYSLRVGETSHYPSVCALCLPVLREIEGAAAGIAGATS